jgi:putative oxidoreductase
MKFLKVLRGERGRDLGLLLLRLWLGLVMAFGHGWGKISHLGAFTDNVAQMGFPIPVVLGSIAAASEFAGGLLIAVGLATRTASIFLFLTMMGAALVVHGGDPFGKKEFALAYAVTALAIALLGPGGWSVEGLMRRSKASGASSS